MKTNYNYLFNIKDNTIKNIKNEDVMDQLYFLESRVPTIKDINDYLKKHKKGEIYDFLISVEPKTAIKKIKKSISTIEHKIPLYDVYSENLYLISKHNIYDRVIYQSYRFPEKKFLNELKQKLLTIEPDKIKDKLELRRVNKMKLMIMFLKYFNLNTLYITYIKLFYQYSKFVGKETTLCKRKSFSKLFHHTRPYFTRNEIINMSLNLGIKLSNEYLNDEKLNELCKIVQENEISIDMLLKHQKYVVDNNLVGLLQYYTLQGSYFINQYLRNLTQYVAQNEYMESLIIPMWNLVKNSPEFDKSYILYRFIKDDSYLRRLRINDIFIEHGFMSTTRDPFYGSESYKFGFILLKVKIPGNIKGVALCVETISHFPEEEEIIFPPNSMFKLVAKNDECIYHHTDFQHASKIKTRYEFEWIGNTDIYFGRKTKPTEPKLVDFLEINRIDSITLVEKIKYFISSYVNGLYQFKVKIGESEFITIAEWYDSTSAYKNYYALTTPNGFSIYSIYKGYVLFFIELGDADQQTYMHVNYYVKYSALDTENIIGDGNFIKFVSTIAHYFGIPNVIIYANYLSCDSSQITIQRGGKIQRGFEQNNITDEINNKNYGGVYCVDIYQYLKNNKKRYSDEKILFAELRPKFSYYDLDTLRKTNPMSILDKQDRDEIYQIYTKIYKPIEDDTIAEFYLWLKDNYCYLLEQYTEKIDRLLGDNNPFLTSFYVLDPFTYLYNRNYVKTYPLGSTFDIDGKKKREVLNKNEYRLEEQVY